MNHARIEAVLKAAEEHIAIFDGRTIGFVEDMLDRLDKWGPGLRVSTKQQLWLSSVEAELQLYGVKFEEDGECAG